VYEKSIGTKINDLDLCLEVVEVMSTIAASISPKLLELVASNLVRGFAWGLPSRRTNNFP